MSYLLMLQPIILFSCSASLMSYLLMLQPIILFSCSASLMSYFSSHLFEQQMFATGVTISAVSLNVDPLFKPKDCYTTH
jgi:hypothetical protein